MKTPHRTRFQEESMASELRVKVKISKVIIRRKKHKH